LFEVVPKKVSSPLRTEFYGKEFALFRHEKRSVFDIVNSSALPQVVTFTINVFRWTMQVIKEEKPDRLPVVLERCGIYPRRWSLDMVGDYFCLSGNLKCRKGDQQTGGKTAHGQTGLPAGENPTLMAVVPFRCRLNVMLVVDSMH
jgi:hypothetical protein